MGIQFLTQFTWDTIVYTQCCALGHAEPKIDFGFLLIIPKKNWVFDRFFWVMHTFAQNWAMRLPKIFYSVFFGWVDWQNNRFGFFHVVQIFLRYSVTIFRNFLRTLKTTPLSRIGVR